MESQAQATTCYTKWILSVKFRRAAASLPKKQKQFSFRNHQLKSETQDSIIDVPDSEAYFPLCLSRFLCVFASLPLSPQIAALWTRLGRCLVCWRCGWLSLILLKKRISLGFSWIYVLLGRNQLFSLKVRDKSPKCSSLKALLRLAFVVLGTFIVAWKGWRWEAWWGLRRYEGQEKVIYHKS